MKFNGIFLILPFFLSGSVDACRVKQALSQVAMDKAEVVFIGRILSVGVPVCTGSCERTKTPMGRVLMFEVEKVLKGKLSAKQVEVRWINGTFGEAGDVETFKKSYGVRSRVGIVLADTLTRNFKCLTKPAVTGAGKPTSVVECSVGVPLPFLPVADTKFDLPWILGGVCTEAFLYPADR